MHYTLSVTPDRFRYLRGRLGMTQGKLASAMSYKRRAIVKFENEGPVNRRAGRILYLLLQVKNLRRRIRRLERDLRMARAESAGLREVLKLRGQA